MGACIRYFLVGFGMFGAGIFSTIVYHQSNDREYCYDQANRRTFTLQKNIDSFKVLEGKIRDQPKDCADLLEELSALVATHKNELNRYDKELKRWGFTDKKFCPPGKLALPSPKSFDAGVCIQFTVSIPGHD